MASGNVNDLYLKYVNRVGKSLENDKYFQYMFDLVSTGKTQLKQSNQVLHKVVDERWISTVEETLDSLSKVVERPRRFLKQSEEVVPVALARKITADSVRHLSMNTQFINSNEDGDVQPSRVLNVTVEDTYDLYENRFVYYLIQRLVTFIDKRTDVIFWSTGDEIRNVLELYNTTNDAYEDLTYHLEMQIKNKQTTIENDSDNMTVFMRIDRVRRLVMALKNSEFCKVMNGCAKVHSPIQRTNLLIKDPDYKNCYRLWQFLESYDEVGYIIEERDSALEFDEEYINQLYINYITNYAVFKTLLETDKRSLDELPVTKKKYLKPKFVHQIKEEVVDDYNIPDVEVRQVIIEEVTEAQLEAEKRIFELEMQLREANEEIEDMTGQIQQTTNQMQQAVEMSIEANKRADKLEAERDDIIKARDEAISKAEAAEKDRAAFEKELGEAIAAKEAAVLTIADLTNERDLALEEASDYKEKSEKLAQELDEVSATYTDLRGRYDSDIKKITKEADDKVAATIKEAEAKVAETVAIADAKVAVTIKEAEEKVDDIRKVASDQIASTNERARKEVEAASENERKAKAEADELVRNAESEKSKAVEKAAYFEKTLSTATEALSDTREKLSAAEKAKEEIAKSLAESEEIARKAESSRQREIERAQEHEAARRTAEKNLMKANSERDVAKRKMDEALENLAKSEKALEKAVEARNKSEEIRKNCEEETKRAQESEKVAIKDAEKARRAQKVAESYHLSKYIVTRLKERESRQNASTGKNDKTEE